MYVYKSEMLAIPHKFFRAVATDQEIANLDRLINEKAGEGWELVTYTYMGGSNEIERGILATFRREE